MAKRDEGKKIGKIAGGALTGNLTGSATGAAAGGAIGGPWGALIGAGIGGTIGGIAGGFGGADEYEKEYALEEERDRAKSEAEDQERKRLEAMGYLPEEAALMVNPELLSGTAYNGIVEDPRWKDAQVKALNKLENWSQEGVSRGELARFRQAQGEIAQQGRAEQQQIDAQQRARGAAPGSGAEIVARRMAAQGASQAGYNAGLTMQQQAEQRAMRALEGYGQMSGQVRDQEWGQATARAEANDRIARFNADVQNQFKQFNSNQKLNLGKSRAAIAAGSNVPADYSDYNAMAARMDRDRADQQAFLNSMGTAVKGVSDIAAKQKWFSGGTGGAPTSSPTKVS